MPDSPPLNTVTTVEAQGAGKQSQRSPSPIRRIVGLPFAIAFCVIIGTMHPVLLALRAFGEAIFWRGAVIMNLLLVAALRSIAGARIVFESFKFPLAPDRPVLVISNHQSMFDITFLIVLFRWRVTRFVSKVELARGIPSVSMILRVMKMGLIDRANPRQALPTIAKFGANAQERRHVASIFPEGTRARDGALKPFKPGGALTLLEAMPNAIVLPVMIDGSWRLVRHGLLPVPWGTDVVIRPLSPIERNGKSAKELFAEVEQAIQGALSAYRAEVSHRP